MTCMLYLAHGLALCQRCMFSILIFILLCSSLSIMPYLSVLLFDCLKGGY